jgi:hypothetical protein
MAGTLVANTINTDTGVFSTNNALNGVAKAWCNYQGGTQTIVNSFNISSVTRQSAGIYTFNFATALPSTPSSIAIAGSGGYYTIVSTGGITTTSATFASYINGTGYADNTPFCMVAFAS